MRKHIKNQFIWRLAAMNPKCLDNGECIMCGCKTPQLQLANRICEGNCYPPLVDKKTFELILNSKEGWKLTWEKL